MQPVKSEIRERMRKQFDNQLQGKYGYTKCALPRVYQNVVEEVTTQRCFDMMSDHGFVRLSEDPDDLGLEDLFGDCYDPEVNSDINPNVLEKQRKAAERRLEIEGLWYVESVYRDAAGDGWHDADGIGGFIGNDFYGSGYEIGLWREALDGYAEQFGAPRYRDCHPDPFQRGPVYLAALRMCGAPIDIGPDEEARYLRVT